MIKVDLDGNKGNFRFEIQGSLAELQADTITIVHGIYEAIKNDDKFGAELYKEGIIENINLAFDEDKQSKKEERILPLATGGESSEAMADLLKLLNSILGKEEPTEEEKTDDEIIKEVLEGGIDENI